MRNLPSSFDFRRSGLQTEQPIEKSKTYLGTADDRPMSVCLPEFDVVWLSQL